MGVHRGRAGGRMFWRLLGGTVAITAAALGAVPGPAVAGGGSPGGGHQGHHGHGGSAGAAQYMYDEAHTGYQPRTAINLRTASRLHAEVSIDPGPNQKLDSVFAQPVVAGDSVYVGDWDGYEYAFDLRGNIKWRTYLGRTVAPDQPSGCHPPKAGVSSTATVVRLGGHDGRGRSRGTADDDQQGHGRGRQVMFVGGGGPQDPSQAQGPVYFYSLDAHNGRILWRHQVGVAPQQYVWSSPTYYRGSVYFGVASFGDCPEVRGHVLKLDARTGHLQADFATAPPQCRAGAVWSSPTIDARAGMVYVTTGNGTETGSIQSCLDPRLRLSWSLLKLRAQDLSLVDEWQVPLDQRDDVYDSDFGTTPTLFHDRHHRPLVGASNKNGLYYAWDRRDVAAGPVWSVRVAPGGACPQCGQAAISPAAFDGHTVFIGGGITTIDGQQCGGNVTAVDPATGRVRWAHCFLAGPEPPPAVLGAVTVTRSLVVVGSARQIVLLNKWTGSVAYEFTAPEGQPGKPPSYFWGAPAVSSHHIWAGNMAGGFYGLALR